MKRFLLTAVMMSGLALTACEGQQMNKQTVGAGTGALIGGILGSQVGGGEGRLWATGAGVLLGALMGSEVGKSLDRADQMYMSQASQQAHSAPIGQSIAWNNPESGHSGSIKPIKDGYDQSHQYCREYEQTIYVGGRQEVGYGTACQQADGRWMIVNN